MKRSFSARGAGVSTDWCADDLQAVADAGFAAVDLSLRDIFESGEAPALISARLDRSGLMPGACPFPYDWRNDRETYEHAMRQLPALLDFAAAIGVKSLYTRVSESLPEGLAAADVSNVHRDRLHTIAQCLKPFGMSLGLEAVGVESFRQGRPALMNTLQAVRGELCETFREHPNVGLLVDIFHLHASGESLDEALGPLPIDRVIGVHVADLPWRIDDRADIIDHERALPDTTGQAPVRSVLRQLHERGCEAPVMIETLSCPTAVIDRPFAEIVRAFGQAFDRVWP